MKPPYGAPEVYKVFVRPWRTWRHSSELQTLAVGVLVSMMVRAFVLFSTTSGGFQLTMTSLAPRGTPRTYCKE